jgi:integrase
VSSQDRDLPELPGPTPLDHHVADRAANVRRDFRKAIGTATGLEASQWTPRELRHSFVSLLSDNNVPLERISQLVGHKSTVVTELIYRQQIRPVRQDGAQVHG